MAKVDDKTPSEEFKTVKVTLEKPSEASETVQLVVAPGRSLIGSANGVQKRFGPGEMVDVPVEDAVYLRRHGFFVENSVTAEIPQPDLKTQPVIEPIRPTVNGRDGSVVSAGPA